MNPAHLDYDVLADLAEGLLDDDRAASANAHLDDCADCRGRSADLADVSRILAEVPVPPMPAELATRIDEAIKAESRSNAVTRIPPDALEARRGNRHLRVLSVAAASVVAVGGAALVGKTLLNSALDGNDTKASSGHAPSDSEAGKALSPRQNLQSGPGAGGDAASNLRAGRYAMMRSGTDYRGDQLRNQVMSQLSSAKKYQAQAAPADQQTSGCVDRVSQGRSPVLVDAATFEGRPATVIALPGEAGTYQIMIVGPRCSAQNTDLIKQTRIAR